jgi:hypothetical protein
MKPGLHAHVLFGIARKSSSPGRRSSTVSQGHQGDRRPRSDSGSWPIRPRTSPAPSESGIITILIRLCFGRPAGIRPQFPERPATNSGARAQGQGGHRPERADRRLRRKRIRIGRHTMPCTGTRPT